MSENFFYHADKIDHKICYGCTLCMRNCPTEAIRVRNGKATIYENKCVPSEFLKGNHAKITSLKNTMSEYKTQYFRPDLFSRFRVKH